MPADLPTRAARPALVSWQLRRPPVEIFFFFFPQFIHVNRAKYQKFRDFSLRMYIGQILPAVCSGFAVKANSKIIPVVKCLNCDHVFYGSEIRTLSSFENGELVQPLEGIHAKLHLKISKNTMSSYCHWNSRRI